ncbi:MAG TPA: hypothetical protein VIY97_02545 [Candidatus Methanoperedens sp.]
MTVTKDAKIAPRVGLEGGVPHPAQAQQRFGAGNTIKINAIVAIFWLLQNLTS